MTEAEVLDAVVRRWSGWTFTPPRHEAALVRLPLEWSDREAIRGGRNSGGSLAEGIQEMLGGVDRALAARLAAAQRAAEEPGLDTRALLEAGKRPVSERLRIAEELHARRKASGRPAWLFITPLEPLRGQTETVVLVDHRHGKTLAHLAVRDGVVEVVDTAVVSFH